jgi:hypothetical protein
VGRRRGGLRYGLHVGGSAALIVVSFMIIDGVCVCACFAVFTSSWTAQKMLDVFKIGAIVAVAVLYFAASDLSRPFDDK